MDFKNVIKNKKLNDYNKLYEKYYIFLREKKLSKNEVDAYLKKFKKSDKHVTIDEKYKELIKGSRKYWLIDNAYYPVPKFREKVYVDFTILTKPKKALIIAGCVAAVGVVVVTPIGIVHIVNNYSVSLNSKTLKIDNTRARKAHEYTTKIEIVDDKVNTFPSKSEISVEIGGQKVDFDLVPDTLTSKRLTVPGNLVNGNITITAEAKYNGFADDSWSTIIDFLNEGGTKALKQRYNVDSLVGSLHDIDVGNTKTKVIVIGENQDHLYSSYYTSASLTFAFADPASIMENGGIQYYSGLAAQSYAGSNIKDYCDKLVNKINDVKLRESINEVAKYTTYKDDTWGTTYDKSKDKIFPLSLKEMGGFDCFTKDSDGKIIKNWANQEWYDYENPCYTFFNNSKALSYMFRYLQDADIWTRTPSLESFGNAFGFKKAADAYDQFSEIDMNNKAIFIPAFTLGAETSFEHDTWDNVISYANQGLDKLKEVYGVNTFVGKEKNLIINDEIYAVRVIGENHDAISGSKDKLAALTFEFTTSVSGFSSWLYKAGATEANWKNSDARTLLNDSFINVLPQSIQDNLKTVTKYSSVYGNHQEHYVPNVVSSEDKVFILSYKELGALDYNVSKETSNPETKLLNKDPYAVEGDTYQYYIDQIKSYDYVDKDTNYDIYGKSIRNKGNCAYLLRSADPTVEKQELYVKGDTLEVDTQRFDKYECLVPCFSIGESNKISSSVFEYDSWENLIKNANEGLDKLKETYKVDSFIGKVRTIELNTEKGTEEFRVRVIGENFDVLASDESKKATLTFEFTRCIDPSVRYDENGSNDWENSTLRNLCNGKYLQQLPSEVQNGIKTVKKSTNSSKGTAVTEEKLFPLSMYEIGEDWTDEKPCYEFYNYGKTPSTAAKSHLIAERIKADAKYDTYHLRTPYIDDIQTHIIYSVWEGNVVNSTSVSNEIGLAPAFAI